MEVIIRPTHADAAGLAAELIASQVRENPRSVLGLATGATMEAVYASLVTLHQRGDLSFSEVSTFNLDEYVGLAEDDPATYRHYMTERLFSKIDIDLANTHLMDGAASDLNAECSAYDALIAAKGGIDLQLLGIGKVGHIGFNEPLSALRSRTRVKALSPQTIEQNAPHFGGDASRVPRHALTLGVGTILESRHCVLLATGDGKAEIVARAVEGPVTSMISATALQLHAHCVVIVDEAAARHLDQAEYYRWIFDNEPEWEPFR